MNRLHETDLELHAVGFDVGGTKINTLNNQDDIMRQYVTTDFKGPYEIIDRYISETEIPPAAR